MTDQYHATTGRFLRLAIFAALLSGLTACASTVDRLSQVGSPPPLTPLEGVKTAIPRATHVAMPMPAPQITTTQPNSLWRTGARSFFKDQRASAVGDILTVNIAITDSAQVDNRTTRTRAANEGVEVPNLLGFESNLNRILPEAVSPSSLVDATSTSSATGQGTVNRRESINMTMAAVVTQILPNGNLVIQGRQEVRINFEVREIAIAGVVRPEDISNGNTIQHSQIAEARISYGGRGQLTDVQQPRYGQQVYDILFPF